MKAFAIEAYNQDPKFIDQTKPQINDKEVLIEVHAASINPLDSKIRKGELKAILDYDMPLVLGNDFSGTVVEKGKNVTKFNIGDEVYGKPRSEKMGTFTEYISLNEADIALKPTNLSFEEAAGIPLVGLTSYQVFNDFEFKKRRQNTYPCRLRWCRNVRDPISKSNGSLCRNDVQ